MAEEKSATAKLHAKLLCVQQKLVVPKAQVNSDNEQNVFHFRSAEQILAAAKPHLDKNKLTLTLSDEVIYEGGRFYIKACATICDTETGESYSVYGIAREGDVEKRGMSPAQSTGSASSYARKYALGGLFLLDDNKDPDEGEGKPSNGNGAAKTEKASKAEKAPEKEKAPVEEAVKPEEKEKEKPIKIGVPGEPKILENPKPETESEKKPKKTASGALDKALNKNEEPEPAEVKESSENEPQGPENFDDGFDELFSREELEKTLIELVGGEANIAKVIKYYRDKKGVDIPGDKVSDIPVETLKAAIEAKRGQGTK